MTPPNREVLASVLRPGQAAGAVWVLDLDCTALSPAVRMRRALVAIAHGYGLPRLAGQGTLAVLPGLHAGAWQQWLGYHGLRNQYPHAQWDTTLAREFRRLSWITVATDVPVPGLVPFVRAGEARGVRVLFVSGRTDRFAAQTQETLSRHGLRHRFLSLTGRSGVAVADTKVAALRELGADEHRKLVVFDDDGRNLAALTTAFPRAIPVAVTAPRHLGDPVIPMDTPRITCFEAPRRLLRQAVVA